MNARIASNIEVAALLPEGVEVRPNQAEFSNLEQARADYLRFEMRRQFAGSLPPGLVRATNALDAELEAANVARVAATLGVPRHLLVGSHIAAAEVLRARFTPDEVRELERRYP